MKLSVNGEMDAGRLTVINSHHDVNVLVGIL